MIPTDITAEEAIQQAYELQQGERMQIVKNTLVALLVLGIAFEILVMLPLTYQIFRRNSLLNSGFFFIFVWGCWMDWIYSIIKTWMEFSHYTVPYVNVMANLAQWYFLYFLTCWNTVLALNRFTALVFVKYYSKFWSKRWLFFICVFMFLYPFLVNGYTFVVTFHCRINTYLPECIAFMVEDMSMMSYINTAHAIGSFIIGVISYMIIKFYQKKSSITIQAATEQKLLFFSIFSSTLLIIFCGAQIFSASRSDPEQFLFWRFVTNILYVFWHYPSLIMLFMLRYVKT